MRFVFTSLALALVSLVAAAGCTNGARATGSQLHTVPHVAGSGLIVRSGNGAMTVVRAPDLAEVEVAANITAGGRTTEEANNRLEATRVDISRDTGGTLTIDVQFPTPRRNGDSAELQIRVPDALTLDLVGTNGAIRIESIQAESIMAATSNGAVTIVNSSGEARVNTTNGRVELDTHQGSVTARTTNGAITLRNHGGAVDVQSTNGRITVDLQPDVTGPISAQASNGSISIAVGPAFAGTVTFRTSNGSINIKDLANAIMAQQLDRRRGEITIGEGGERSNVRTNNGSITFETRSK